MATIPTQTDRLYERMLMFASVDRLMLMRNLSYGGAAACLVVLVGLTQVGAKEISLQVSVVSASVALPMWLLLGGIYEFYIFLGKQSYPHLRTKFALRFIRTVLAAAGLGSIGTTAGVIWYLMPAAAGLFGAICMLAATLGAVFHIFLARWWFGSGGPGANDGNNHV